jgi:pimeloyl-ACP methyl ester carboxylesterase
MAEPAGILYLPSGPGLNSGPPKVFLESLFRSLAPTIFWNEPSEQRGDSVPSDDGALWRELVDSLVRATDKLPERFVIATESFGSVLAEILYRRLREEGRADRIVGIFHSPPVMEMTKSFRRVIELGAEDFNVAGDSVRHCRLVALQAASAADPRIDSRSLLDGIVLAFESPALLPRFFRSTETLSKWASGFAAPGFAPEPQMRERYLCGIAANRVPAVTIFAPDVPTFVCQGEFDPYHKVMDVHGVVQAANASGRKHPIQYLEIKDAAHYPQCDRFDTWRDQAWNPFWRSLV